MTERTWSTVEVSAYLDGQLEPALQATLETDMAQDPALRQQVEALRQVQQMVRSVPMREPPRNYLLTPAMVAEPEPRRRRRPIALMAMRLATSVVALAFVVTFGLTLQQQRGLSPSAVAEAPQPPAAMRAIRDGAAESAPAAPATEAPAAEIQAQTALPEATQIVASQAPTDAPAEGAAFAAAPVPDDQTPEATDDLAPGTGGGGVPDEEAPLSAAAAAQEAPAAGNEAPSPEGQLKAQALPPTEAPAEAQAPPDTAASDVTASAAAASATAASATPEALGGVRDAGDAEVPVSGASTQIAAENIQPTPQVAQTEQARLPLTEWLSIGFGIATAVLLVATIWIARRRAI